MQESILQKGSACIQQIMENATTPEFFVSPSASGVVESELWILSSEKASAKLQRKKMQQ